MQPVRITASSGRIDVIAESRPAVLVERGQEHPMGGVLEVKGESSGVSVRIPIGTDVVIGSHSGPIRMRGECGDVRLTTRSGRVEIESCASLDVRSASGRITVGRIAGDGRLKAGSGRVDIDNADGPLRVATVSGRVTVGNAAGPVRIATVNGRVTVDLTRAADVRAESVSGAVKIGLPRGVNPETSMHSVSGRCSCAVEHGTDGCITARSVSGRVEVVERR